MYLKIRLTKWEDKKEKLKLPVTKSDYEQLAHAIKETILKKNKFTYRIFIEEDKGVFE